MTILHSLLRKSRYSRINSLLKDLMILFVLIGAPVSEVYSQGNLLILPRRVVFEGSAKSQEITLANTGNDTAKFIVSLKQYRMKEDGAFEEVKEPDSGQMFADKYLRFYPRTVMLGPKKSQTVKMQFVKSPKMEPGEYRSHIYFRAVPKTKLLGETEVVQDTAAVTAKLVAIFGITVPVIIRIGESTAKVSMSGLSFEMVKDTLPKLKLTFNRSGNFSVFGDIVVKHISDIGKETKVATVKGIAIYTPNAIRQFQCNLEKIAGIDYKSGKLVVEYSTPGDPKVLKLSEAELVLK